MVIFLGWGMSKFLAGGWGLPSSSLVGKTLDITVTGLRYKYGRITSDDWRCKAQCHGCLLLLITSYIHHCFVSHNSELSTGDC